MSIDAKLQKRPRDPAFEATMDKFTECLRNLTDDFRAFAEYLERELESGVPSRNGLKIVRDEKESRPVAAGSKEFICDIPDPRLRRVYRRRMRATDRRTDWRS